MKTNIYFFTTLGLAIAHNILFWNEYLGINVLLFSILLIFSLYRLHNSIPATLPHKIILVTTAITSLCVVYTNSVFSIIMHMISIIILISMIHFGQFRNLLLAFLSSLVGIVAVPKLLGDTDFDKQWIKKLSAFIRIIVLPVIVLIVFYVIFLFANARFYELNTSAFEIISKYLILFFENFSIFRLPFFIITFFWLIPVVYRNTITLFKDQDEEGDDFIHRRKQGFKVSSFFKNAISLKLECKMAFIAILMLNILLAVINTIDIQWLWFNFQQESIENLSQFVHEGTYLLIGSILLSMAIMLYTFRRNLNFYPGNHKLKILIYLWIFQNAILAISVGIRNYHYINEFGLAYKRIGVIIFLLITIGGLVTLIFKIKNRYSSFYLWRSNAWIVYLALVFFSMFDWDHLITKYNLEYHGKNIDWQFLLSMSDKTLPVLVKNEELIPVNQQHWIKETLELKKLNLIEKIENTSLFSWNYADYVAWKETKDKNFKLP